MRTGFSACQLLVHQDHHPIIREAADEIERLQKEVERLQKEVDRLKVQNHYLSEDFSRAMGGSYSE